MCETFKFKMNEAVNNYNNIDLSIHRRDVFLR